MFVYEVHGMYQSTIVVSKFSTLSHVCMINIPFSLRVIVHIGSPCGTDVTPLLMTAGSWPWCPRVCVYFSVHHYFMQYIPNQAEMLIMLFPLILKLTLFVAYILYTSRKACLRQASLLWCNDDGTPAPVC